MAATDTSSAFTEGTLLSDLSASMRASRADPDERAARDALRGQIARLELELSRLVARSFPHVLPRSLTQEPLNGPRLLSMGELERARDELVDQLRDVERQARERAELERRSRALLARMALEPSRHKRAHVAVRDLGGVCGVWRVRPRFGLLGMLAGWWELKLSSGCP